MSDMLARYETTVYPRNLNSDYGIPVVVYASNRQAAVDRAAEIGWSGRTIDARVDVLRVEQVMTTQPDVAALLLRLKAAEAKMARITAIPHLSDADLIAALDGERP